MDYYLTLLFDPTAWIALSALVAMEVVLGIDNLVFISVLTNKLPKEIRFRIQRIGIAFALILRLALLGLLSILVGLTAPLFSIMDHSFSLRDIVLILGGLFLVWKATKEIHEKIEGREETNHAPKDVIISGAGAAIAQIILLDLVFSIDSIVTAVGMVNELPIMFAAVIITVGFMMVAARPLSTFVDSKPSVLMLALSFLIMIGMTLIADGFGFHVPKGYIYAAMAFSAAVEALNIFARRKRMPQS